MVEPALDKIKVRQSFSAAARTYDGLAAMQRQVGSELLRRFPLGARDGVLLDLGSGTGYLTRLLAEAFDGEPLALDIALPMLLTSRGKLPDIDVQYLCADAEHLPLADGCVGQIYSNLALQWIQDLPGVFADCKRVLQGDGQLVFATFGPQTLWELKAAWAAVDDYAHVNAFYRADEIGGFLSEAGFCTVELKSELYRYDYPSVQALMAELKGVGAHNVNLGRKRKPTTRSQLRRMMDHYPAQRNGEGIVASYEIIFARASL